MPFFGDIEGMIVAFRLYLIDILQPILVIQIQARHTTRTRSHIETLAQHPFFPLFAG